MDINSEKAKNKFWNFIKDDKETYVELANWTEMYYDRFRGSNKADPNYEKIKQIVLIQRFKLFVDDDLKTYLDQQDVETLHEIAMLADDYDFVHKLTFEPEQGCSSKPDSGSGGFGDSGSGSSGSCSVQTPTGVSHGSNAGNKPSDDPYSSGFSGGRHGVKSARRSSRFKCFYCKKPRHFMSNCWRKMADVSTASPDVKPQGFVSSVKPVDRTPMVEEITDHFDPKFDVRDEYRPSVSVGSVSSVDSVSTSVPANILCDTGATQTLESKHTLHFDTSSATGDSVTVQTSGPAESGCISVPLHHVNLVSDIVSGSDVVGVMNTRPVEGVSTLSENDSAAGKVIAEPEVVKEPVTSAKTNMTEEETSSVVPSCVVTQARASKMAEDTRASNKMDGKQDKDGDPSIKVDDKDQDPLVKTEDQSVMDQDPSITIDRNWDKDQDDGLNEGKWHLSSDGDWRNRKKTKPERWRQSNSDPQGDRHGQDRECCGTKDDEPREDDGHRQKNACDDRGPRRVFCDDERGSLRDSDDHHVPVSISDQCHQVLCEAEQNQEKIHELDERKVEKHETEVQIERSRHEEIDRIGGGERAPNGELDEPEASDWRHGTTEAMDVDCQKAFDNTAHHPASVIASGNENAVRGNSFVGKLDFLPSRLGYVVLLGALWRFPYLYYGNSSGAFLLPLCIVMHICFSIPLILTEVLFRQFASAIT